MRVTYMPSLRRGSCVLKVTPRAGERLNREALALLPACTVPQILRPDASGQRWHLAGLMSLRRHLSGITVTRGLLVRMLGDVQAVLHWCRDESFAHPLVLYEARTVFVDANGGLRFVAVPLDHVEPCAAVLPTTLLRYLGATRKRRFEHPSDALCAQRILEFAERQSSPGFSVNRFDEFLQAEVCGSGLGEAWRTKRDGLTVRDVATGRSYGIGPGERYLVGRAADCALCIPDCALMSRRHAAVWVGEGGLEIEDLGSTNGSRANRARLEPGVSVRVRVGGQFSLAGRRFVVERMQP